MRFPTSPASLERAPSSTLSSWRAATASCCSTQHRTHSATAGNDSGHVLVQLHFLRDAMQRKDTRKAFFQIATLNNGVDEAMLKRKLCRLESFGQRLFDGVLDYTTASKTDKRMGLGK